MQPLSITVVLLVLSVVFASSTLAQEWDEEPGGGPAVEPYEAVHIPAVFPRVEEMPAWHSMVTNIPKDWATSAKVVVCPESIEPIVGIGFATGLLVVADRVTFRATRDMGRRFPALESWGQTLVHIGDGKTHLAIAGAFAGFGFLAGDARALRTGSQTVESLLASGIVVQLLKRITGRESPEAATHSRGRWKFFPSLRAYQKQQTRYYAFPSGHITTMMSTATVIAENYPEVPWIRPVGYMLVGLVGISLVNGGYHWYSDLPLGIGLGYLFGKLIAGSDGFAVGGASGDLAGRLRVVPHVSGTGVGLAVALLM
jgi:hypothetical protein